MAKYVIVNADDYGIAASVSQGIRATAVEAMRSLALLHHLPLRHDRGVGQSIVDGIPHPVSFYELDHDQPIEVLLSFLKGLPEGDIVELCCHPGYSNDTLSDIDNWTRSEERHVGKECRSRWA